MAWQARLVVAPSGLSGRGLVWHGMAGVDRLCVVGLGLVWQAWLDALRRGQARQSKAGSVWHVPAR